MSRKVRPELLASFCRLFVQFSEELNGFRRIPLNTTECGMNGECMVSFGSFEFGIIYWFSSGHGLDIASRGSIRVMKIWFCEFMVVSSLQNRFRENEPNRHPVLPEARNRPLLPRENFSSSIYKNLVRIQ